MVKKEGMAISTLIAAFLIHAIIGTFHIRSKTWIYSYLSDISIVKFSKNYLDLLFSISSEIYNIFIIVGVILKAHFNTLTISAIGLSIRILCNSTLILLPHITVVSIAILISGASCGLVYLPILLDIWKYFPKTKGAATAFVLSGFGISRLLFKYITSYLINPENVELKTGTYKYPKEINESYLVYLKQSHIFFCGVSVLAILLIYPYDIYVKLSVEEEKLAKKLAKKQIKKKDLEHPYSSMQLSRYEEGKNNYYEKYNRDDDIQEIGYLKLIFGNLFKSKIEQNILEEKEIPVYEPLISLIVSYPFVQLTFVFFFGCLYSVIELSTLRRLGLLFGLHEDFLWRTSLIWKIMNACFFSLWGFYLDKFGIKKILMTVLVSEIINNSMCYFLVQIKIGFIITTSLSAAINSAYLGITPTCYALIFGDEKGILLYSISSILINTFYLWRTVINHIVNDKVYFLMLFMIMTIFSMFALIILCFFEEKKHVFKEEIIHQKKESFFRRASELSDIDTNGEENSEGKNSLFKGIENSPNK